MGPKLLTRLTVLKCGWGTGPFHTVKRHSTHQYFFCSAPWDILLTLQSNLQNEIYVHLHQQSFISGISMKDLRFAKTLVLTFTRQHMQVLCRFSHLFIIMVIFGRLKIFQLYLQGLVITNMIYIAR